MNTVKTALFMMISVEAFSGASGDAVHLRNEVVKVPAMVSYQPDPHDPKTILAKAIEAHGGRKNILKPRKAHLKGTEKLIEMAKFEEWIEFPNRWKLMQTDHLDREKHTWFVLSTEGKAWKWKEGTQALQQKDANLVTEPYFGLAKKIVELTEDKYTLLPLEDVNVGGKLAVGLRAEWNKRQADCYFDEKSGLLVRWDLIWQPDPDTRFHQKNLFEGYKEIDGVKIPFRRQTLLKGDDSKDFFAVSDTVLEEIRILDKLPDGIFSLPKKK